YAPWPRTSFPRIVQEIFNAKPESFAKYAPLFHELVKKNDAQTVLLCTASISQLYPKIALIETILRGGDPNRKTRFGQLTVPWLVEKRRGRRTRKADPPPTTVDAKRGWSRAAAKKRHRVLLNRSDGRVAPGRTARSGSG